MQEPGLAEDRPAKRGDDFIWDSKGRALSLPLTMPAAELLVRDAFGAGSANSLRAGTKIEFKASTQGPVNEPVLFSAAPLRMAPGEYDVRFHGALQGSLKLRFAMGSGGSLRDAVVKTFDVPTRVVIKQPLDALEIIGLRTKSTRTMTLASIEILACPPTNDRPNADASRPADRAHSSEASDVEESGASSVRTTDSSARGALPLMKCLSTDANTNSGRPQVA